MKMEVREMEYTVTAQQDIDSAAFEALIRHLHEPEPDDEVCGGEDYGGADDTEEPG